MAVALGNIKALRTVVENVYDKHKKAAEATGVSGKMSDEDKYELVVLLEGLELKQHYDLFVREGLSVSELSSTQAEEYAGLSAKLKIPYAVVRKIVKEAAKWSAAGSDGDTRETAGNDNAPADAGDTEQADDTEADRGTLEEQA